MIWVEFTTMSKIKSSVMILDIEHTFNIICFTMTTYISHTLIKADPFNLSFALFTATLFLHSWRCLRMSYICTTGARTPEGVCWRSHWLNSISSCLFIVKGSKLTKYTTWLLDASCGQDRTVNIEKRAAIFDLWPSCCHPLYTWLTCFCSFCVSLA